MTRILVKLLPYVTNMLGTMTTIKIEKRRLAGFDRASQISEKKIPLVMKTRVGN